MQKMITWQGEGNTRSRFIATTTKRREMHEKAQNIAMTAQNFSNNDNSANLSDYWFNIDENENITMSDMIWSFVIYGGFAVSAIFTALLFFLT